ncbi:cytochrome c heme-lyase [Babesia microti strain RI]|uniref:Holocytochrome c-type synthase n=1 Tax=Babesia microti (strain RI) TaxID=1133968 RepID=A0A1R4AB95_BABMR|nr:cytochrome c heme-lyase [Babesia microti strain RI]SJK86282.1 cytochrome c heme-lyase [Babesia microti strain RI]|eukprot:XP_021338459.1 cytochrome c heme-lyase [Babesia microti strain RI]
MAVKTHFTDVENDTPTESNIPSRDGRWKYPSQKQFYNATTRNGNKVNRKLIPHIVQIHNQVNEEAWRRVLEYEDFHDCANPFLSHFSNNKKKLSVKARVRGWIGYDPPFDRHDWLVERCGTQIRYIIDFYKGVPSKNMQIDSGNNDINDEISIYMDVRPAPTIGGIIDRLRMSYKKKIRS